MAATVKDHSKVPIDDRFDLRLSLQLETSRADRATAEVKQYRDELNSRLKEIEKLKDAAAESAIQVRAYAHALTKARGKIAVLEGLLPAESA
ncbi:MAG: hypothetical protein Hyperionvirus4_21 [Hyperionvirus sp.]|uniref:Uncharacterized protein n=1 Tax=Hyperionvirus sp. TaxID=2487770 RepID=A0A3G5A732_9VIRU|nr:MAG: hypothetical protein Hyperionvirus4_21 [Hyperionvirus sp.]